MPGESSYLKISIGIVALALAASYTLGYLQNLDSQGSSTGAFPANSLSSGEFPEFRRADNRTGLDMNSMHSAQNFIGFSGVYVTDYNRDGWEDVLGVDGHKAVLFENREGEFNATGYLSEYRNVASAHFFDYDNSGYDDLLLLRRNDEPVLLRNMNGKGFEEVEAGFNQSLTRPYGATSADYDRDGCLDVFIVQWGGNALYNQAQKVHDRHPEVRPTAESSYKNYFYEGDCSSFEDVTSEVNAGGKGYFTFTASFTDFSGDGYPDIYMPNDFGRDIYYRNNRNGTFTPNDIGPESDRNAMSSETAFLNDDTLPDIFVTNVYYPENFTDKYEKQLVGDNVPLPLGNNLFINNGSGFQDQARDYGVRKGGWGWASTFSDFSNSGRRSIIHSTDNRYYDYRAPSRFRDVAIFKREEDGTFTRIDSVSKGFEIDTGRGISKIDYNNDGRLDVIASTHQRREQNKEHLKLYENTNAGGKFLQVILNGSGFIQTNTELVLETSSGKQRRLLNDRSDFLSQESSMAHFGLDGKIESLEIIYPDGEELVFKSLEPNKRYIVDRETESIEAMEE